MPKPIKYQILRNTRNEKDIPIFNVATALGLKSTGTYHKKERGDVAITVEEAKILCKMFDTPFERLFKSYK